MMIMFSIAHNALRPLEVLLLVKNLSALSTSAPAPSVRVDRKVSRRGTCDCGIWMKSVSYTHLTLPTILRV